MSRCELHTEGPLRNRCELESVLTIQVLVGAGLDATSEYTAAACAEHAWEATARGAHDVCRLRSIGHDDARVVALVERAGEELLDLLQHTGIEVGDRWPLAKPWGVR